MGEHDLAGEQKSPSPPVTAPPPAGGSDRPTDDVDNIEAASGPSDEDEFDLAEGWEIGSTGSQSATSSIYAHTFEHGRRYQNFKYGRYPIPNDDIEQSREDMKHAMLKEVTDGRLFYAPIGDHPQMIVDIGTGTGIWAIEVGDEYPSARVRGIDLSPTQPTWVPPNVDFLVDDCNADWLERDCDLIHLRFMAAILKDKAHMFSNAYRCLKPGGWIEIQEFVAKPACDDGTMYTDDPVKVMYDLAGEAFAKFGMDTTLAAKLEPMFRDAGFVNIQCVIKKVPLGVWAKDKTLRLVGLYQKLAVLDLMPVFAGRPFTALGMTDVESQVTLAHARRGLEDTTAHRYFSYYFWFAQKPLSG